MAAAEAAIELVLENAAVDLVVDTFLLGESTITELCELVLGIMDGPKGRLISKRYLQRLGKHIIQVCEGRGRNREPVPEECYDIISRAMMQSSSNNNEDEGFCWVWYNGTGIRILDANCAMEADMDGDFLGLRLWEAEICALEWMEHHFNNDGDTTTSVLHKGGATDVDVLEIGCGVSLAGFAALERMQARSLTLCDYNKRVVDNLNHMLRHNENESSSRVHVVQFDWNDDLAVSTLLPVKPRFILAADCVYDPTDIPNFVLTLVRMLSMPSSSSSSPEESQCLLVCSVRNPSTFAALERELDNAQQAEQRLRVTREQLPPPSSNTYATRSTHMMTRNWKREEVVLFMLRYT